MASICSEHQGYDTDCPRCNSGVQRHVSHGYDPDHPCPVCDEAFKQKRAIVDEIVIVKCMCGTLPPCECGYRTHKDHSLDKLSYIYCPNCGRRIKNE